MRSIDDLVDEAKYGQLTKDEISYVVQKIKESTLDWELDMLIFILGLSQAKEHRKLLESFLYYPSFPMVSGTALKSLCRYWDEAQNYLDQIKTFIKGVDWDDSEDLRLAAIHCAGDFLSQTPEKELLLLLLNIYNESNDIAIALKNSKDPDQICDCGDAEFWREVTFQALAFAVGRTIDDFIVSPDTKKNHLDDEFPNFSDFIDLTLEQVVQLIESLD